MKFTILVDNKTEKASCCAEWGLSILIESRGKKILFDTGTSPMFAANAKALGVDLSDVDALVFSHSHYDHTGGAQTFASINKTAPIYLHEEAMYATYGETDGVMDDYNCGILWDDALKKELKPRIHFTSGLEKLYDHIWIMGNIPSMKEYPPTENFFRRLTDGPSIDGKSIQPDPMNHEQCLIVEEDGKLHVFSGCSHKGVIPTLNHVGNLFPGKKIAGLVAGMHLYSLRSDKRSHIIDRLVEMDLDYVAPLHCTGMQAIVEMKVKMGDKCRILTSGHSFCV